MNVVVAGGSGFLGRALIAPLRSAGHRVRVLTRKPRPGETDDVAWSPDGTPGSWSEAIEGVDAIVNLAGEGIGDRRWSERRKGQLHASRVLSTRSLVAAIAQAARPPAVLVN